MNNRRSSESGPHRIIPAEGMDPHAREIAFEGRLMKMMGVRGDDNDAALAWVKRYADPYRRLVESDDELRALIASDPERAVKVARERLAPAPGVETAAA